MTSPKKYRMDRTAFKLQTVEEADEAMRNYTNHTIKERLEFAYYLTSKPTNLTWSILPGWIKQIFA